MVYFIRGTAIWKDCKKNILFILWKNKQYAAHYMQYTHVEWVPIVFYAEWIRVLFD